jgi:hypothetical protein
VRDDGIVSEAATRVCRRTACFMAETPGGRKWRWGRCPTFHTAAIGFSE